MSTNNIGFIVYRNHFTWKLFLNHLSLAAISFVAYIGFDFKVLLWFLVCETLGPLQCTANERHLFKTFRMTKRDNYLSRQQINRCYTILNVCRSVDL